MSIANLVALTKVIQQKWQLQIVNSRPPGERASLQAHMGTEATYESVTEQITDWLRQLEALERKPRISNSISKPLLQAIGQCMRGLEGALNSANNGVDWICSQRNFAVNLTLAAVLIREVTSEHGREVTAIADAARERIENDLVWLQEGSSYSKNILENKTVVDAQIKTLSEANDNVTNTTTEFENSANEARDKIIELRDSVVNLAEQSNVTVKESVSSFNATLKEAQSTLAEASALKSQAETLVKNATAANDLAANKFITAENDLNEATAKQKATNERLTKALQSAQMEGLAGSFTKKADEAELAIKNEQTKFQLALLYLAAIGLIGLVIEWQFGFAKTSEEFSFRLIRTLSMAAPGIWIAWTATRKLAALNRIFSDYQYKSASALAYESYRQTVAEAGDDELKKQLLAFAIRSFGENPTRYFDAAQNDPTSPADSWLSKFSPWSRSAADKPNTST